MALHHAGEHSTAELGDLFGVGRSTCTERSNAILDADSRRAEPPLDKSAATGTLRERQGLPRQIRRAAARDPWLPDQSRGTVDGVTEPLTLTAVFTPDEDGWTMAQLAEWPAVVTCGRTVDEARAMLLDAAHEMLASYRDEGREPPIGGGHVEQLTIDVAAA